MSDGRAMVRGEGDDEIDLGALVRAVARRWWLVALVGCLGTGGALAYALNATLIYRARAVIAPPSDKKMGAASAAFSAFGGLGAELAGSMGISLGASDASRLEALLTSHRLLDRVVARHDLLPVLFADRWDRAAGAWVLEGPDDKPPNVWNAAELLRDLYRVKNDPKLGVLTVTLELADAGQAREVLGHFLAELALLVQEDEVRKIQVQRRFVEEQLRQAVDPFIVAKLQSLLSDQVEKAIMARNVENVAYDLIDPPAASDQKVKPRRSLIVALGGAVSLTAGVALALALEARRGARARRPTPAS